MEQELKAMKPKERAQIERKLFEFFGWNSFDELQVQFQLCEDGWKRFMNRNHIIPPGELLQKIKNGEEAQVN